MGSSVLLPEDFADYLIIENAQERLTEASKVAEKIITASVRLLPNLDHAAIFADPPHLVAGPLKQLGYISGWDARCYPSPVDGYDYINVSARLHEDSAARSRGWFDYVAVVHPVNEPGLEHMLSQGYGNPFIHHLTWGIVPPERTSEDEFEYSSRVVPFMVKTRAAITEAIGDEPGTLIIALPQRAIDHSDFANALPTWVEGLESDQYQVESMEGGGFLIQFFVLTGGRIEVVLRVETQQTFNPKSVHKISQDEISAVQEE